MSARRKAERSPGSVWRGRSIIATLSLVVLLAAGIAPVGAQSPVLDPIDSQLWVDQGVLTWEDYLPVPDSKPAFYDVDSVGSQVQYKTAIILVDYPDQPFLITQPPGSHPFGNPQPGWTPVAQEDVNEWMYDYYAVPNQYNGFKTLHSYWMEDTHGRIGIDVEVFGPYRMPAKSFEYGLATDFNGAVGNQANSSCPAGHTCSRDIRQAGLAAWQAATGCTTLASCGFNNGFYVTAGHDESSTWQEFGEMLWVNREDVPATFGPPGATSGPVLNNAGNPIPNWAPTRYVPWTSWRAAANHWPNAGGGTSTQAESSGQSVFAHEFSHLRGLPDNYNNPFADNQRAYTGYWEMMSRGTFNGPGGTHNRWQIPNAGGSALGPHHMLHYKNQLGVLDADEQVTVQRDDLAGQGAAVARVLARESVPEGSDVAGITVQWGSPTITGQVTSPSALTLNPTYFTSSLFLNGTLTAEAINAGNGSTAEFAAIDATGKIAFMRREATGGLTPAQKVANAFADGAAAAIVYNNTTGTFTATVGESIPAFSLSQAQGDAVIALLASGPVTIQLVGRGGDLAGSCARQGLDAFNCFGTGYLNYRMEVVDRVGNDSYAPGHGVLLGKSRNSGTPSMFILDPNPQDIGMIDFYRPDGTPVAVVRGDPRQINDASFHAGTRSDSEYEYVDNFNRLHFYVIDKFRDADGVLYYDLGVRRLDGAGPFARGVDLGTAVKSTSQPDAVASCTFPLTNTGQAGTGVFDSDIYRLSATSSSGDWEITLPNALATAKAGATTQVEVHATRTAGSGGTTLSLTAKSETDSSKTDTATCALSAADGAPVHRRAQANGQLVLGSSIGTYAGDDGTRLYSNVDVRSTGLDGGDDPHGTIEFAFTSGGKSYRLESDDIASLRVALDESSDKVCRGARPSQAPANWCTGTADIQATATLFDDSKQPQVAVLEGLRLEVSITDRRTPGGVDSIAITAWDGNKQVFSSSWSGFAAVEQALASGTTKVQ